MDLYGFHHPQNQTHLHAQGFLFDNLKGICRDLIPAKPADVFISTKEVPQNAPAVYSTDVILEERGIVSKNVFVLSLPALKRYTPFGKSLSAAELFGRLWSIIFHEMRHFVQSQLPLLQEHLFEKIFLKDIEGENNRRAALSEWSLHSHRSPKDELLESDATLIQWIAILNMGYSMTARHGTSFDYEKIKKILLMTKAEYDEEKNIFLKFAR